MAASQKDTIYIDVDDEITTIIDKVQSSPSRIIALVLPKRAMVFQSVVNLKLLRRVAAEQKKNLVLITSEASLLPMAGAVGLHVARSLQSKPEVPLAPTNNDDTVAVDETEDIDTDAPVNPGAPIGALAGLPASDAVDSIEVDNDDPVAEAISATPTASAKPSKPPKKNKKLQVPNFDKFRLMVFGGAALLVLLIVGWWVAFNVMPKARITIKTNNVDVLSSLTLASSVTAKNVDTEQMIVPGELKQYKKTDSQKVTATGKKDQGTKASGSVTLSLADCSVDQITVPSGTTVSSTNLNFITQADVILKSVKIGPTCQNSSFKDFSTGTVKVLAENAGDQYNLSARPYAVSGYAKITAGGTAMSGGTSKIVTVVSQQDVDGAKQKILDTNKDAATQEVTKQLTNDGFLPLADTLVVGEPLVTATPNVDTESADVTVNLTITYSMSGVKKDGVKQLLDADIKKHIDTTKQDILNDGLDKSIIKITDKQTSGNTKFTLQATASAGVQQNADEIKKLVAGKKKGDLQAMLTQRPGVKDVTVEYSPFWVYSTPKSVNKITVVFQQSNGSISGQ